ncbi:MAG: FAD:protein FMN transferase [Thermoguttaceae bacterium]
MAGERSRRDFLRGRPAPDPDAHDGTHSAQESYAVHISRKAMACEFEIVLNAGQYESGTEVALDALELVEQLEAQLSYFRPDSQVSHINRTAADEPVPVEPGLFSLLVTAAEIFRESDGAFDLTAAPLWKAWGFARRSGRIPAETEIDQALRTVGGDLVQLDPDDRTVRFLKPGVEINLGSIGKGYALDRVAQLLETAEIRDYLVQGGQSSVRARGNRLSGGRPDGWLVGLGHPLHPGNRLGYLRVRDRSVGTSGSASQFFRHKGRRYSHILDPRTGRPAEGVLSATVLADDATRADALATAFFVMGREPTLDYCRAHPELAVVLILAAPGSPGFEIVMSGLPDEDFVDSLPGEDPAPPL